MPDLVKGDDGLRRCSWGAAPPDYQAYHDDEWGRPVGDDVRLYEKLCLEGFQSGLSWLTILRKRQGFRRAFAGFDPAEVARFGARDIRRLVNDASIVRHRGQDRGRRSPTRGRRSRCRTIAVRLPRSSGRSSPPAAAAHRRAFSDLVSTTPESTALSKELKRYGFRFVGPTTAYAAMQSLGLVNDHLVGCTSRAVCTEARAVFTPPHRPPPDRPSM